MTCVTVSIKANRCQCKVVYQAKCSFARKKSILFNELTTEYGGIKQHNLKIERMKITMLKVNHIYTAWLLGETIPNPEQEQ